MKTAIIFVALIVASQAAFQPYDNVDQIARTNIWGDCGFASYHMWQQYGDIIMNNWESFLNMLTNWLKNNVLYILLTPYVNDAQSLSNAQALWAWFTAAVETHGCCGISMATYIANTLITNIWGRIDFTQFKSLLFENLNKYKNIEQFYWDEFWMTCPFTFSELYYSYIKPYIPL